MVDNDDNTNNNNIITNYGDNTDIAITRNDHDGGDSNVERIEDGDEDEDSGNCYVKENRGGIDVVTDCTGSDYITRDVTHSIDKCDMRWWYN